MLDAPAGKVSRRPGQKPTKLLEAQRRKIEAIAMVNWTTHSYWNWEKIVKMHKCDVH
jgi:hypothetical protein